MTSEIPEIAPRTKTARICRTDGTSNQTAPSERQPAVELLQAVISACDDPICLIERPTGKVSYANRAAERLFGYVGREWENATLHNLVCEKLECLEGSPENGVECHVRCRNEHVPSLRRCVIVSPSEDAFGIIFRTVQTIEPMTHADRDPLTGLANRKVFESRLEKAIDRHDKNLAVLFVDLDDFKEVNDRYGHSFGDQVLRNVAERLVRCLRPSDTVARYGGDEFVVLLEGVECEESARNATGRLLYAIGDPVEAEDCHVRITASAGIVLGGQGFENVADAIRLADRAMYRAKALGRHRFFVFDEQECPPFPKGCSDDQLSSLDP